MLTFMYHQHRNENNEYNSIIIKFIEAANMRIYRNLMINYFCLLLLLFIQTIFQYLILYQFFFFFFLGEADKVKTLIRLRAELSPLFTGKRNASKYAWA